MTQILEYIKDPAWWFSAFFIAIIASVVAGFAKDYIQSWIGNLSAKAKQRQSRRSEDRERALTALEENETFLIISMIRAVALLILMMSAIILFVVSPMWSEVFAAWCQAVPADPTCSRAYPGRLLSLFASVMFGSAAALASFRAMTVSRIAMQGFRRYRRKHGLPVLK